MKQLKLTDLAEGLREAVIRTWYIKPGDTVEQNAPLLAFETAKAIMEAPSPCPGVITAIHVKPGETILPETLLVTIDEHDH